MRRLLSVDSSIQVITASWPLRNQDRSPERNRFFASCWLMVEAPETTLPFFSFFSRALEIASQSNPSWPTNFASSAATTARFSCVEMRSWHPLVGEFCPGILGAQPLEACFHESGIGGLKDAPPQDMGIEPALHDDDRKNQRTKEIAEGLPDRTRRTGAARGGRHQRWRSAASTDAVSGRRPRQSRKDSAACSTSMPEPSRASAPAARTMARNGVSRPYTMS